MSALHQFASSHPIAFLVAGWFLFFGAYMWALWTIRKARNAARNFKQENQRHGGMWD